MNIETLDFLKSIIEQEISSTYPSLLYIEHQLKLPSENRLENPHTEELLKEVDGVRKYYNQLSNAKDSIEISIKELYKSSLD